ncbi:MAG: ELM1/GtrOC1 family putative glycosyltransferase [Gammaproteobacteria bacterium]|nr:ELM1/GtrOC1 family putative glycosyltransferase [Gammaproteobacteria bacterium]
MADPIIWLLLGRKLGDNTQILALAEQLGYPYQGKKILARSWELIPHLLHGATLAGIDKTRSSPLRAPWPDLVITAGRRNEPVAHWIRRQSGGHSKLVHIGRPWSALSNWGLIVTTPQYFLPAQDNVVHNRLPLLRMPGDQQRERALALRSRLQDLPPPYTALLVGGDSGRFVFTTSKGRQLGRAVNRLVADCGGSLLLTDSPRTPSASFDALLQEITVEHFCYRWRDGGKDNPYLGYLALAEQLVVTGESMSMLAEASATGKRLHIFDMGDGVTPWWRCLHNYRYKPLSHHFAMRFGPTRMRRDIGKIQQALVDSGQAVWLGQQISEAPVSVPAADEELELSAVRVRGLLASTVEDTNSGN